MDIPVAKVRKILKIAQEPISLETPIGEEEDSHLGDFIDDKAVVSPSYAFINPSSRNATDRLTLSAIQPSNRLMTACRVVAITANADCVRPIRCLGTTARMADCVRTAFFFQAEDGIRDLTVTGVQTCALPI